MHIVRVAPTDAGWVVQSDAIDNELMFRNGARAEAAAKRLAAALAAGGSPVKLDIHRLNGAPTARFLCPPDDVAERAVRTPSAGAA